MGQHKALYGQNKKAEMLLKQSPLFRTQSRSSQSVV